MIRDTGCLNFAALRNYVNRETVRTEFKFIIIEDCGFHDLRHATVGNMNNRIIGRIFRNCNSNFDRNNRLNFAPRIHVKVSEIDRGKGASAADFAFHNRTIIFAVHPHTTELDIFRKGTGRSNGNKRHTVFLFYFTFETIGERRDCFKCCVRINNCIRISIDPAPVYTLQPAVCATEFRQSTKHSTGSDLAGFNRLTVGREGNSVDGICLGSAEDDIGAK